jgi:hypothetical protein
MKNNFGRHPTTATIFRTGEAPEVRTMYKYSATSIANKRLDFGLVIFFLHAGRYRFQRLFAGGGCYSCVLRPVFAGEGAPFPGSCARLRIRPSFSAAECARLFIGGLSGC